MFKLLRYPILQTIWTQVRLLHWSSLICSIGAVWLGFILFASMKKLIWSAFEYMQQVSKADNISGPKNRGGINDEPQKYQCLALKAPITTKVVCFSRLLKCFRSLYKQCGPRSYCSYRSSLIWVHPVDSILKFVSNVRQLFAAEDFSRCYFSESFFLGALRVSCDYRRKSL